MARKRVKSKTGSAARAGAAPDLSRAQIVELSTGMVRNTSFSEFSMRALAAELNVTPPAIYHHFANREALLLAVADNVLRLVEAPDSNTPWRERLEELLVSLQRQHMSYPGLPQFLAEHLRSPATLRWVEMILDLLLSAGFEPSDAVDFMQIIGLYNNPAALRAREDRTSTGWDVVPVSQMVEQVDALAKDYPAAARCAEHFRSVSEHDFRLGVRLMIAGFESRLPDR